LWYKAEDYMTAKATWNMCGSKIQKSCIDHEDFTFIVEELRPRLEREEWELMAILARSLWVRWNALIFGGLFIHPTLMVEKVSESLVAFQSAQKRLCTGK